MIEEKLYSVFLRSINWFKVSIIYDLVWSVSVYSTVQWWHLKSRMVLIWIEMFSHRHFGFFLRTVKYECANHLSLSVSLSPSMCELNGFTHPICSRIKQKTEKKNAPLIFSLLYSWEFLASLNAHADSKCTWISNVSIVVVVALTVNDNEKGNFGISISLVDW